MTIPTQTRPPFQPPPPVKTRLTDTLEMEVTVRDLLRAAEIFTANEFIHLYELDATATSEWLAVNVPQYAKLSGDDSEEVFATFLDLVHTKVEQALEGDDA